MHNPSLPSWLFNDRMLTIAHKASACKLCSSWVHHYVEGIIQRDISLTCAEATQQTHFQADLVAQQSSLTQNNDVLHMEVTTMHDSLETVQGENDTLEEHLTSECEKLSCVEDDYRDIQDELRDMAHQKDKCIHKLDDCISKLQQEIQELNTGSTPCRHKMA